MFSAMMFNRLFEAGMMRLRAGLVLLSLLVPATPGMAARLVVKIQAANPSTNQVQSVELRASLPARVTTNDVMNLAGLNLGYDVKSDSYYVYGTVQLAPKEIVVREVELNDIWVLDEEEVKSLETRAEQLSRLLLTTPHGAKVQEAGNAVKQGVATILERQAENRITRVSPVRHIQAYESNLKALQAVRQQVGQIENLALAAGINPGDTLIGDDRRAAAPRRDVHVPVAFGEAVYKITVRNSSPTQPRRVPIRRDLPAEVGLDDVLDANGLSVRFDPKDGLTAVYDDALELAPLETKTFNVRIRDKWNVNGPRIDFLGDKLSELRTVIADRANLQAVANMLDESGSRLAEVAAEKAPDEFTPAYIAFYRRQADRLDLIEQDLNRIDAALKPLETKRGFPMPAPDKKTTWLIIYVILGFLALLSLLFFMRWFVRSS
jgi:hypothetical protein